MAYSDKVLDHYENPRNVGSFSKEDDDVGTGMVGAPACGDVMKLQIKVGKDGLIEDAKFKTYGCVISTTKVSCFDHQRAISTLRPGDTVISWNGMHFVPATIREVHTQYIHKDQLIKLRFDGFKKTHSVVCTRDHVWWAANQQPIESQDLQIGQECFDITEQTLRQLTNVRHREDFKSSLSERMRTFNKGRDNSYLVAYHLGKQLTDEQKQLSRARTLALHKLPEYWAAWEAGMKKRDYNLRPTGLERKFIAWFDEHSLTELSYVGDGQFWAGKSHLNPDFKVKGQRKVIEVFTEKMPEFMMARNDDTWKHARTKKFNEAGFDCLYLSVEALVANPAKVLYETQQFIHNGIKLIDTKQSIDIRDLGNCERDGDFVKVYDLSLEEGANVYFIGRVGSHNCGSAIASSSLVTEWVKGKTLDQALDIKNTHIAEELALPPVKIHCSILAEDAIKAAVEDYKQKHPTPPEEA